MFNLPKSLIYRECSTTSNYKHLHPDNHNHHNKQQHIAAYNQIRQTSYSSVIIKLHPLSLTLI